MTDEPFVAHRSLLFTVAYEMLGSAADAEDVVQETWLRWAGIGDAAREDVRDPRAYLVRIVTRQALTRRRTPARRREAHAGGGGAGARRGGGGGGGGAARAAADEPRCGRGRRARRERRDCDAHRARDARAGRARGLRAARGVRRAVRRARRGRGQVPGRSPADRPPGTGSRGRATTPDAGGLCRAAGRRRAAPRCPAHRRG